MAPCPIDDRPDDEALDCPGRGRHAFVRVRGSTAMTRGGIRALEGRRVSISLADGSRTDDCDLISVGRGRTATLWIVTQDGDSFLPLVDVDDVRPAFGVGVSRSTLGSGGRDASSATVGLGR